ncbi:secreted RxLR effector protein 161-like [Andrographis paniculata]|uniref:secreted RxLR effector protein 161-like n=1 Tax=Andrographis paniculata TaxID=175694 RepID=UPI0021E702F0|nr:secreted RxLR effector protein 161-like [Andrographis paniculata]
MNPNEKLSSDDETGFADASKFRSLVGRLVYLTHTRLDIAFPVGLVSRFMHRPSKQHYGAAKRILRYLAGTRDYGIWYTQSKDFILEGFTDSDWAGFPDDRKSTSRNCFSFGAGPVSWLSKKQSTVALSSAEAEYVAAATAACVWLRRILEDLNQV